MSRGNLILIVDDNNQNLEVLGKILNNNNYRIALAQEGQKALDFVENKKPDLILLDIMMPGIDGFEVCKRLKANQWSADIPVIFISALDDTDKKLKAFEVGGVDYIPKPFHKQEVLARVETQLKLSQTKQELEIKTEKQNILLNNIETQVWYLTDESTYGKANQSHARFLGIEQEKIEGKSISEFLDQEATEICITGNREVFVKKKQIVKKEQVENAQGDERILKIIKTPRLDENGGVKYVVCSAEDVTDKERLITELKKSEEKFRSYVNQAPDAIFIVDRAGNYLDVNQEALVMLGYTREELLTMNLKDIVAEEELKSSLANFEKLIKTGELKQELKITTKDGSKLYTILEGRRIAENKFLSFVKDITEKKKLENELKDRINLENFIVDLSRQFINHSEGVMEEEIAAGLEKITEFFEVDYTWMYLYSDDKTEITNYYYDLKSFQNYTETKERPTFNLKKYPWLLKKLKKDEIVDVFDVNNLAVEAQNLKERLLEQGVISTIMLPLKYNNKLIGILGLNNQKQQLGLSENAISSLNVLGDIFTNVIKRKKYEEQINQAYIEVEMQNMELENLYSELEAEFKKASQLHQQFLPTDLPVVEEISYDTYFQPSDKLGGDFYDIIKLQDQLLFYLADVSGHGLDGSMLNIFLRETINNYLLYEYDEAEKLAPSQLISYVAEKYGEENFPEDYFICLLAGVVDIEKMEITFANAGFQFCPLKVSTQREMLALNCRGLPISTVVSKDLYYSDDQDVKISLDKGDTLFLTTDGLLEERVNDEMYGKDRLQEILLNNYNFPVEIITKRIKNDFSNFSDSVNSQDDITFLCLQRDLDVIDSFRTTINSTIEEMYKIKGKLLEFVAPYYKPPSIICIGFQEILTNAIEHGNQKDADKKIEIEVEVTTKYIKIVITDEGAGFDWQQVVKQEFDVERDLCNGECRGRGIKIANKAYDEIWYNEQGNQAHLYKLLED